MRLPLSASGSARVAVAGGGLRFALAGASGRRSLAGRVERFKPTAGQTTLAFSSENEGVGWQARTPAGRQGLAWRVWMTRGLHPVLTSRGVAFRNAQGRTVWLFAAPTATRAGHALATRLSVRTIGRLAVIHVRPSLHATTAGAFSDLALPEGGVMVPAVLPNPDPITYDGQVVPGDQENVGSGYSTGDCYVDSSSPDTSLCEADTNYVGPDDNTLENFDITDAVPQNVDVLNAFVSMELSSESATTAEQVGVWQAGKPWTDFATWDTYDGTNSWTTPGGDVSGSLASSETIGASGDVGSQFYWDVTGIVQGWVDQNPSTVDGLIFKATAGSSAPNTLGFQTEADSTPPYIAVTYQPRQGDYPGAKYDSQVLTDRSSLGVNVANDNLMLSNSDVQLAGINGLGLSIGRYYNNLSDYQGAFGTGWTMGAGTDSYMTEPCGSNTLDYFDGTGDAEVFNITGAAPPGVDMKLSFSDPGDPYNSSSFTLLARHTGITETFDGTAGACNRVLKLASLSDRNGNTISYHYNDSGQLSSITDSYGTSTTVDWGTNGYVSKITDPTGRTYQYFQNSSGQLTQYEDPSGNSTYYSYDSSGDLTQIELPSTRLVNIAYNPAWGNEVASIWRPVNQGDTSGPETTYQTAVASGSCPNNQPANAGWMQDSVQNPDGYTTLYCTDSMGRLTGVVDALGHTRSTSYNPDGYVSNDTDQLGIPTAFTYSSDGDDNITALQYGSGSGALSASFGYSGTSGTDNQYLPSSATDTSGNMTSYTYGTGAAGSYGAGEPTSITDQLSTQNQATLAYNPNGTVKTSTDPDGNQTTYGYTSGNLTTVTPPAGSGLNPITLTYDSANHVKTISTISGTPATGHEVDYSYNDLDQVTQAIYKDAAGSTVATIGYTYDPDGNLTQITDPNGDTDYSYDGLGRLTSETYPSSDEVDYSHDPAGNITGVTDPGGEVGYFYNKLGELTSIKDPGASRTTATVTYNADGEPLATTYASGASIVNTYNALDQLTQTNDTYKTSSGTLAHLAYSYGYTTGGLESSVTDQAGTATDYTYDALNRLTQATTIPHGASSPSAEYQYGMDGNGNILQQTTSGTAVTGSTTSYAYNPGNEICWSYNGSSSAGCGSPPAGASIYSYDADGNETSNGDGLTMTYNALDQMTSATNNGTTTDYSYLGESQALLYGTGSQQLENSLFGVTAQGDGGASSTTYYTRSQDGQLVDERTSSGTYNYLYDGNGNVIGLTDNTGHLVKQYAYDPYGNTTSSSGSAANPFGFQSAYQDASGLDHFGARYLNPTDGSWTQEDPLSQINDLTQIDRYVYAGDDPINISDPSGECIAGFKVFCELGGAAKTALKFAAAGCVAYEVFKYRRAHEVAGVLPATIPLSEAAKIAFSCSPLGFLPNPF